MEKQNSITIDIFGYEDETLYPLYNLKQTFQKHVDLLLLSNSKIFHYV